MSIINVEDVIGSSDIIKTVCIRCGGDIHPLSEFQYTIHGAKHVDSEDCRN